MLPLPQPPLNQLERKLALVFVCLMGVLLGYVIGKSVPSTWEQFALVAAFLFPATIAVAYLSGPSE